MLQFDPQDSCLDCIQPPVVAFHVMVVFLGLAMVAHHLDLTGDFFIVSRYRAALSASSQVLSGIETECRGPPHGSGLLPCVSPTREILGPVRLADRESAA